MLSVPAGLGSASGDLVGIIVGAGAGAVEVEADLGVGVGPVDDVAAPGVAVAEEPQATITARNRSQSNKANRSGIRNHLIDMDLPPESIFSCKWQILAAGPLAASMFPSPLDRNLRSNGYSLLLAYVGWSMLSANVARSPSKNIRNVKLTAK